MSRKHVNAAMKATHLPLYEQIVLITLAEHADKNGTVTISNDDLTKAVNRNMLTVLEASLELEGLL